MGYLPYGTYVGNHGYFLQCDWIHLQLFLFYLAFDFMCGYLDIFCFEIHKEKHSY